MEITWAFLKNPMCEVCGVPVKHLVELNLHMMNIHSETDDQRINRMDKFLMSLTNQDLTFSPNIKSFDCTECGYVFNNEKDMKLHNDKNHTKGVVAIEPDVEFLTQIWTKC